MKKTRIVWVIPEEGPPVTDPVARYGASAVWSGAPTGGTRRSEWAAAAAYYWGAAYAALVRRDYRAMRENARIAAEVAQKATPEGALLSGLFGGCRPAERVIEIGRKIPADQAKAAEEAVRAEMARHAAQKGASRP